jgi:hypothetical protein
MRNDKNHYFRTALFLPLRVLSNLKDVMHLKIMFDNK